MISAPSIEYPDHLKTFKFFKLALHDARNLMNQAEMMELADDLHQQIRELHRTNSQAERLI